MKTTKVLLAFLALACDSEPYVPVPIRDPEIVRLMNRYGLTDPHYSLTSPECRFMDGRRESFTARTADGNLIEGSICAGSDFGRGPRIELR